MIHMAKREEKLKEKQNQSQKRAVQELKNCLIKNSNIPNDTAREMAWAFFYGSGPIQSSAWRFVTNMLGAMNKTNGNNQDSGESEEVGDKEAIATIKKLLADDNG